MELKITYPSVGKMRLRRNRIIKIARWPLLCAAVACPVVNYCTGGKAWSIVALMGIYMAWKLVFSPDLVEYNRISQFIKAITYSCVLLALIDIFLTSGWATYVVPLVCLGGLAVSGVLFFTDLERQKQNMRPLLLLIFLSLAGALAMLCAFPEKTAWPVIAMGSAALALLVACAVVLGGELFRELKRRFHVK